MQVDSIRDFLRDAANASDHSLWILFAERLIAVANPFDNDSVKEVEKLLGEGLAHPRNGNILSKSFWVFSSS